MTQKTSTLIIFLAVACAAVPAHAYVGPGLGAGAVAAVLGIIASIFLALFAVLWYPIKRLVRWIKKPASKPSDP